MSIARHHAEWLSLVEISGPFLSMPVLLRTFPQGLDAHDPEVSKVVRRALGEWQDNQQSLRPDPAIHTAWVRFVLHEVLGFPNELLSTGPAIPESLRATVAEHGATLRPDMVIARTEVPVLTQSRQEAEAQSEEIIKTSAPLHLSAFALKPVRLLIQIVPPAQDLDKPLKDHRWKASPATRMAELLRGTGVRLGLLTNGERWMLVHAQPGETAGFSSWYASLWLDEPVTLRAFRSLLGVARFYGVADPDTLEALITESAANQQEVTDQLGYQVREAVEVLVQTFDRIDKDHGRALLQSVRESMLYEAALTVMMRLVFLFSAEERGLLRLGKPMYDEYYAISTLRAQLRAAADETGEEVLERRHDAWSRLLATFRAVFGGVQHEDLRLPAYGGHLFDPDRFPFLEGRAPHTCWIDVPAHPLPVDNRTVLHLLEALQVLRVSVPGGGPAEPRRLSFRALDIEQIGHVYEGMLDHTAKRAAEPVLGLVGSKDREPEIPLTTLEAISRKAAKSQSEEIIETSASLPLRDFALKTDPDERLAQARRLIADRCLYGVDKNPLAVEMSKLSLWLITLQKDRPFSFLDHALRAGDSLLGLAHIDQLLHWSLARDTGPITATFLTEPLRRAIQRAMSLRRRIRETPVRDVRDAERKAGWLRDAEDALGLVRLAADLLVSAALHPEKKRRAELSDEFQYRISLAAEAWESVQVNPTLRPDANREELATLRREADALLEGRQPFHWPLEFPEVFLEEELDGLTQSRKDAKAQSEEDILCTG